jgi:cytochrome c-type biogenesis protein
MAEVTVLLAMGAGLLSFLSPCVLPLVPSYLSYVAGVSFGELEAAGDAEKRRIVVINALAFILGFSAVFVALGASFSLIGRALFDYQAGIRKVGGVLIVLFGLYLIGLLKLPALMREFRPSLQNRPAGFLGSALVGVVFASGWTPCVGPILGAILTLASTAETGTTGIAMLGAYSLGLGIPFFASALAVGGFLRFFARFKRFLRAVDVVAGLVLVAVGVLLFTGYMTVLNTYFIRMTPEWLIKRL